MMRGKAAEEGRQRFVQLVLQNKDFLKAKLSNSVTQAAKDKLWEDIRNELVSAGALQYANKSAEDMRKMYSDMKRRTMDRVQKSKTTGAGKVVLSAVDNLILDYVGRESPAINGLPVADSENAPTQEEIEASDSNLQKKINKEIAKNAEELKKKWGLSRNFVSDSEESNVEVEETNSEKQSLLQSCSTQSSGMQNFLQNMSNAGHILPEDGIKTIIVESPSICSMQSAGNDEKKKSVILQQREFKMTATTPALNIRNKRRQKTLKDYGADVMLKEAKLEFYHEQIELCKVQKEYYRAKTAAANAICSEAIAKKKIAELEYQDRMRCIDQSIVGDPQSPLN